VLAYSVMLLEEAVLVQFGDLIQDDLILIMERHRLTWEIAERRETEFELHQMQEHLPLGMRWLQIGEEKGSVLSSPEGCRTILFRTLPR